MSSATGQEVYDYTTFPYQPYGVPSASKKFNAPLLLQLLVRAARHVRAIYAKAITAFKLSLVCPVISFLAAQEKIDHLV